MKIWIIYTLMFGYGVPTKDEAHFTNKSGCEVYLRATYRELVGTFQLACVDVSPTTCQGKVCE